MIRGHDDDARNALLHAAAALALGVCVYSLVRTDTMWLLPHALHAPVLAMPPLVAATGSLPVLAHVWAMAWLTALALGSRSRAAVFAAPAWAAIDVAFEIGQHPQLAPSLAALARPVDGIWLLGRLGSFFIRGSFDPLDIAAAVAAGAAATVMIARRRRC